MKKELIEFRVKEYDGIFEIQRKEIQKTTTGCLWWKKTKEEVKWKFVDKWGNCLWDLGYLDVNNYHNKIKPFTDLQTALDKIDKMISGAIYHYKKSNIKQPIVGGSAITDADKIFSI